MLHLLIAQVGLWATSYVDIRWKKRLSYDKDLQIHIIAHVFGHKAWLCLKAQAILQRYKCTI